MRIALVVHKFPPASLGGTEVYTQNLAQELSRCGHQVFVFFRHDEALGKSTQTMWEERDGFRTCRVSRAFTFQSASLPEKFLDTFYNRDIEQAFDKFLSETQPDIVHFQHVMSLSYRLVALAKRRGLPVLLTLHDYWFICSNSQLIWPNAEVCRGKALGANCARCALVRVKSPVVPPLKPIVAPLFWIRDALVRQTALSADRLLAPSHFLIQKYVEAGFPATRFTYLENGIDAEHIRQYSRQPSGNGQMRFIYLGSLAWQKGVHVLVEAFRGIPPEKAVLRIYGSPTVFPEYTTHLRQLADPANTFFEGAVPNEEVGRILAETDVVAVPSLWHENSPVVIQEAFAARVPVLASQIGALTEKVQPGVNGVFCAPGRIDLWRESLLAIIEHQELMRNSHSKVFYTTIQESTRFLMEVYRSMK